MLRFDDAAAFISVATSGEIGNAVAKRNRLEEIGFALRDAAMELTRYQRIILLRRLTDNARVLFADSSYMLRCFLKGAAHKETCRLLLRSEISCLSPVDSGEDSYDRGFVDPRAVAARRGTVGSVLAHVYDSGHQ